MISLDSADCSLDSEHYSKLQVNIFNNDRYYKLSKFLHTDNNNAKAITIPPVFPENGPDENSGGM